MDAIQGLPPGATVTPIAGASSQIQGLPPGATVTPIAAAEQTPAPPPAMNPDGSPNTALPFTQQHSSARYELGQLAQGATSALSQVGHTAERVLAHVPGIGSSAGFQQSMADDAARANAPMDTPGKMAGAAIENILEFASGDEALKGLSVADKVAKLGKVAQTIEKYPAIARVLKVGATQGAMGAAQGGAHGQSVGEALTTGAITGGTGGLLEGAGQGVGKIVDAVAPSTRPIAGVDIPALASQSPDASTIAKRAAPIASSPEYQGAQQTGARQAIENLAQGATRDSLERVNATRPAPPAPTTDPARMLPAPADMQPYKFTLDTAEPPETPQTTPPGSRTPPGSPADRFSGNPQTAQSEWQYNPPPSGQMEVSNGRPGTATTSDPAVAHATLAQLQDVIEDDSFASLSPAKQAQIRASADSLQSQIEDHGRYMNQRPNFDPIDSGAAAGKVSSFRDAAQQIEGAVQPVYSKLDEVSGGQWKALRMKEQAAIRAGDPDKLADIRAQQQQVFENNRDLISRGDWQAANGAWKDASTLKDLHSAIQRSFAGPIDDATAARTGVPRNLVGGAKLTNRLNTLLESRGDDVRRVIGQEGTDHLYQLADLLKPAKVNAAKGFVGQTAMVLRRHGYKVGALVGGGIGHHIGGWEGGAAGAVLGASGEAAIQAGYRRAVNYVATSPKVASRLAMAVNNNVSPRVASPLLASMMLHLQKPDPQPQQPTGDQP